MRLREKADQENVLPNASLNTDRAMVRKTDALIDGATLKWREGTIHQENRKKQ
jgi:hypothetical protein